MIRIITLIVLFVLPALAQAQCAMCRTQVVNNVSAGETMTLAQGLNYGIMYLFFAPYVALGVVAFFWYKKSKKRE